MNMLNIPMPRASLAALGLLLSMVGSSAWAQLSFLTSSQSGFTTQTYTSPDLKTIDFNTVTLANAPAVTSATTLGSSGGAYSSTATASLPTGFSGNYSQVTSGTGSSAGSKLTVNFAGGTPYVSFLWNLATGDSDNTVKFNLSNGSSVSVSNCSSNTATCVGGYDTSNLFTALFSLIFGSSGGSTQSARLIYQPPSGVTVSSMELTALRYYSCTLIVFCSYSSRTFKADAISYVDNSASLPAGLHHVEILSDVSSAVTCQTSTFKVRACSNAACTSLYTGGVTGTLTLTGGGASFPSGAGFTIASGSSLSSSISAKTTTATTLTAGASSVSPAPTATGYCGLGAVASNAAGACNFKAQSTGLSLSLPAHRAGTAQTLQVSLVKNVLGSCVSVGTGSLSTSVTAVYSGATSPTLSGNSLTSGVAKTLTMVFSGSGLSSPAFQFDNSGLVSLKVDVLSVVSGLLSSLVGVSGNVVATVAPAAFKVEPVINGAVNLSTPVGAGNTVQLKISALNGLSTPTVTTNFGSESGLDAISIARTVLKPTSRKSGAVNNPAPTIGNIVFANGVATVDLTWSEVGSLDLSATLGDYLGSGMSVTGALSSVLATGLRFVPDSFVVTPTAKCGAFTYAGQPFDTVLSAVNASGNVTLNYDGSQAAAADRVAKAVTVAPVSGATGGSLGSTGSVAATAFGDGTATASLTYAMTSKLTAPNSVALKATDADVADSNNPSMTFRSGRIKLSNAFGTEKSNLQIPVVVQYWSGKSWVPASDDTCTTASVLPTSSVSRGNYRNTQGAVSSAWTTSASTLTMSGGVGVLTLAAPGAKKTGTVDVTLDLSGTGANLPWLQSLDASCGANTVCNPKARATFGVYTPETKKTVNVQDAY